MKKILILFVFCFMTNILVQKIFEEKVYAKEIILKLNSKMGSATDYEQIYLVDTIIRSMINNFDNDFIHYSKLEKDKLSKVYNNEKFQNLYMKPKIKTLVRTIPREEFNDERIGFTYETQLKFQKTENKIKRKLFKLTKIKEK